MGERPALVQSDGDEVLQVIAFALHLEDEVQLAVAVHVRELEALTGAGVLVVAEYAVDLCGRGEVTLGVRPQLFFPMDDNYFSLCTTTTATSC